MAPVQEELQQSEKKVAECNGRVSALSSEIERAVNDAASRKENTKERIESMKQSIIDKRAQIRQCKQSIDAMDIQLDKLDELDEKMQNLENQMLIQNLLIRKSTWSLLLLAYPLLRNTSSKYQV